MPVASGRQPGYNASPPPHARSYGLQRCSSGATPSARRGERTARVYRWTQQQPQRLKQEQLKQQLCLEEQQERRSLNLQQDNLQLQQQQQ